MSLIPHFLQQLEEESVTTRKMLERVPIEKSDWKPHEKSMALGILATHVAELPSWITMTLNTHELDFANNAYKPADIKSRADLMDHFEQSLSSGKGSLQKAKEEDLAKPWTLRNGDQIYSTSSKGEVIRMSISQIIHHRAQLGVFLRLLDIPIPGSYGPSADDMSF
jgi:uncharacterized damage-inducible protein DinB